MPLPEHWPPEPFPQQALEKFETLNTPWQQGRTLEMLGDIFSLQEQDKKAKKHYQQAMKLYEGMGAKFNLDKINKKPD